MEIYATEKEARAALREDILQDRAKKGLSQNLEDIVAQAYLVSEEYGDIWKEELLTPLE